MVHHVVHHLYSLAEESLQNAVVGTEECDPYDATIKFAKVVRMLKPSMSIDDQETVTDAILVGASFMFKQVMDTIGREDVKTTPARLSIFLCSM